MIRWMSLHDAAAQPWRNGGGTTRELLAWPSAEDWALRISVARIEQAGPFSAFAGINRCFAVLSGQGVELTWQDRAVQLRVGTAPLTFDGTDPPVCRLLGGATEDLNLMLGQHRAQGRLVPVGAGSTLGASWRGVYTTAACTLHAGQTWPLSAHCLAFDDEAGHSAPWRLEGLSTGQAFWVDVELSPS